MINPSSDTDRDAVADTARWTAAARARESDRADRLFDDPLAAVLAGQDGFSLLAEFDTVHSPVGGNPFLPIRTRWFDDVVIRATSQGIRQVVALAAGLDTRGYRLEWPAGTVLFELDQRKLLGYKQARLEESGLAPRCDRRVVCADLTGDWAAELLAAGYDVSQPTSWFAEGLMYYLPEAAAAAMLRQASAVCSSGSDLAVDLIGTGVFRLPYMQSYLGKLRTAGSPWRFGTDDPAGFVRDCGWQVDEVAEPGHPAANFGRWPQVNTPRRVTILPRSYLVHATRA